MWGNSACISRYCEFRSICRIDKDGGFLVALQQLYEVINQPVHLSRAPCVWSPLIGTGSHYKSIVNRQTPAYKRTTTISNSPPLYWKKPFVIYCQRKGKWRGHLVKRKKMKNCHVYQSFVGEWNYIPSCLSGPHVLFCSSLFSWRVAPFFLPHSSSNPEPDKDLNARARTRLPDQNFTGANFPRSKEGWAQCEHCAICKDLLYLPSAVAISRSSRKRSSAQCCSGDHHNSHNRQAR